MPAENLGPDWMQASTSKLWVTPDPGDGGAIRVRNGITSCAMTVGPGSETRTVPAPLGPGLTMILSLVVDGGGTIAITFAAAVDSSGNTIATFGDLDDSLIVISVPVATATASSGYAWVIPGYTGTVAFS